MRSRVDELAANRDALDALFRGDGYGAHLGADLEEWGGGWARVSLLVEEHHRNFAGWLHGGVTFSLADVAFAVASNSWGRLCVALSVDVQFLATVDPGTTLVATCRERHRSARTGAYLMEVRARAADGGQPTDAATGQADAPADGAALVGSLHALVHRSGRWHLGEDAWSRAWRAAH
ncbi:MAG: hotdog fold thioesterase [Nitriliruptoraceae bacterium]|nr:hotdog fold thioesterase [Nitriliruptoraceae bacterium]